MNDYWSVSLPNLGTDEIFSTGVNAVIHVREITIDPTV